MYIILCLNKNLVLKFNNDVRIFFVLFCSKISVSKYKLSSLFCSRSNLHCSCFLVFLAKKTLTVLFSCMENNLWLFQLLCIQTGKRSIRTHFLYDFMYILNYYGWETFSNSFLSRQYSLRLLNLYEIYVKPNEKRHTITKLETINNLFQVVPFWLIFFFRFLLFRKFLEVMFCCVPVDGTIVLCFKKAKKLLLTKRVGTIGISFKFFDEAILLKLLEYY